MIAGTPARKVTASLASAGDARLRQHAIGHPRRSCFLAVASLVPRLRCCHRVGADADIHGGARLPAAPEELAGDQVEITTLQEQLKVASKADGLYPEGSWRLNSRVYSTSRSWWTATSTKCQPGRICSAWASRPTWDCRRDAPKVSCNTSNRRAPNLTSATQLIAFQRQRAGLRAEPPDRSHHSLSPEQRTTKTMRRDRRCRWQNCQAMEGQDDRQF